MLDLLQKGALTRRDHEVIKTVAVEMFVKLQNGQLLMGNLRDFAAKQAPLRGEIEIHLWASGFADMDYSEEDVVSRCDAVFAYLFAGAACGNSASLSLWTS